MKQVNSSEKWNVIVEDVPPFGLWILKSSLILFILLIGFSSNAQIGGRHVYTFLNLPGSARVTALGGSQITVLDEDVNFGLQNPAVVNQKMDKAISFQHNFHFSGISNGFVSTARHIDKWDATIFGGIQYIGYGDFIQADVFGNREGTFKANELALVLGGGKQLNERMRLGANIKIVSSRLAEYNSFGLALDAGWTYTNEDKSTVFSAVLRNIGGQLSKYHVDAEKESIPFDLQFGISKRLKHLPFRFTVIAHDMHRWNLLYDNPNEETGTILIGNTASEESRFGMQVDNLFRHLIFSGEFLLGKQENFNLRFAYNHQRKKELSVPNARSIAGFSMGFGLRISKFTLDYGMGVMHLAGTVKHIGLSTNLNRFGKNNVMGQ